MAKTKAKMTAKHKTISGELLRVLIPLIIITMAVLAFFIAFQARRILDKSGFHCQFRRS